MYGGTKTEMERLLRDADKLSEKFNLVEDENGELVYSFDDIVAAIHIVQEEMGITGKTAEEAAGTISGSVAAMKSAWSNLITGIADDNADFDSLMDAFIATIVGENGEGGVINNIAPKIETALDGVLKLVEKLAPKIIGALPDVINKYLPDLVNTAISALSLLITAVGENSDSLAESIASAISTIISHAAENTPDLVGAVLDLVLAIISELGNNLGTIVSEVVSSIGYVLAEVAKRAPELTDAVFSIVNGLVDLVTSPENSGLMTTAGLELMLSLLAGMALSIPQLVGNVGAIIDTIKNNFTYAGWEESGEEMASQIGSSFNTKWAEIKKEYSDMWADFTDVYNAVTLSTGNFLDGLWTKIKGFFDQIWSEFTSLYNRITEAVGSFFGNAQANMTTNFNDVVAGIKDLLGIHSPSKVFYEIGENMALGLNNGWNDGFNTNDIAQALSYDENIGLPNNIIGLNENSTSKIGNIGGITFNVYGSDYANVDELADSIMDRLNDAILTREETYA